MRFDPATHLIDPRAPEQEPRAIGFVDLARWGGLPAMVLPPWPVIGIGDPAAPLASRLDAVCEAPVTPAMLVAGAAAAPHAAAVATQLLRGLDGVAPADALVLESLAYATLQGGAEHRAWLAAHRSARMPPGEVRAERDADRLTIKLDRPAALNAIDVAMRDGLREALAVAVHDESIGHVSLRAEGRAFSIGGDLAEFGTTRDPVAAHRIRTATLPAHHLAQLGARLDVRIEGACVGAGSEMAAFARRVTATRKAWFQLPELAMGLIPGAGGCVSVPRRIGRSRALLMILSGRRIGAADALRWGLVDRLVDEAAGDPGGADADGGEVGAR